MTTLFDQLVQDHVNLQKTLDVLSKEIYHISDSSELEPHLPLILDVLEYVQTYPETFHHPLEEVAFNFLEKKQLADKTVLNRIRQQHRDLERLTAELQQQVNCLANGHEPEAGLLDSLQLFVEQQQEHLETENRHIMPTLQQALSEGDWWDIASVLTLRKDPLFDQRLKDQFSVLAARIFDESRRLYGA